MLFSLKSAISCHLASAFCLLSACCWSSSSPCCQLVKPCVPQGHWEEAAMVWWDVWHRLEPFPFRFSTQLIPCPAIYYDYKSGHLSFYSVMLTVVHVLHVWLLIVSSRLTLVSLCLCSQWDHQERPVQHLCPQSLVVSSQERKGKEEKKLKFDILLFCTWTTAAETAEQTPTCALFSTECL